ncbi:MAG TPA: hypothetical protein VMP68_33140 [Candidatus Eisenbacteria bacterium]|nr:hypothetical protein [Candidatus Eisenbacteria bacterium]
MLPRTIFLSKLLGLYCLILAFSLALHKTESMEEIAALVQNAPDMLVVGVFTLFAGLAMILGHNLWHGGGVTIVVTLIGWVTLLKSVLILLVPASVESRIFLGPLHSEGLYYFRLALTFLLGVYLTYGGFTAASKSQPPAPADR